MDKGEITMIENLHKNTGKTLEQWITLVNKENIAKHGDIVKFLKEKHQFTHGFANLIALKSKAAAPGIESPGDNPVDAHYKGNELLKPIYDKLLEAAQKFGDDVEVAPKKAYVSLRRKKQFALLQPVSKNRFEVGIILKNQPAQGKLEAITTPNAMCTHKINLATEKEIDKEVLQWLKKAYEGAG